MSTTTRYLGNATRALLLPLCMAAAACTASAASLDYDFQIEWQDSVLATGRRSFEDCVQRP